VSAAAVTERHCGRGSSRRRRGGNPSARLAKRVIEREFARLLHLAGEFLAAGDHVGMTASGDLFQAFTAEFSPRPGDSAWGSFNAGLIEATLRN